MQFTLKKLEIYEYHFKLSTANKIELIPITSQKEIQISVFVRKTFRFFS